VLTWSADAHRQALFVSAGSHWAELERTDPKNWTTIESFAG
jgi:hypothetical protein